MKLDQQDLINTLESELKEILGEFSRTHKNRIKRSTRVREDLGIDSFTALEILVAIEIKYKIKIPESDLSKLNSFEDILNFISLHIRK